MSHNILIVDDESDIRELVSGILTDEGYTVRTAADGVSALALVKERRPSAVILDVWLGESERDGLRILELIQNMYSFVPIIMISGHSTVETAVSAIQKGAYDFIEKPFKSERLLRVIERAIESSRLQRENNVLKVKARVRSPLIGNSTIINQLRHTVDRVAPTNGRIFISTPFGFDRSALAHDIHEKSKRAKSPFIQMNCATILEAFLEKELFGLELNSSFEENFTAQNYTHPKIGLLEQAHTGTLFIDDITLLSPAIQSKLIKVLHENSFSRMGGEKKIHVDVRIIAGTSQIIQECIQKGTFREDLFYRISVTHLEVPALIERRTDIPLLMEHYIQEAAIVHNLASRRLSEAAMAMLQSYAWPGDIEQLRNVADRLVIITGGDPRDPIEAAHLPIEIVTGNNFISQWQRKSADIVILPLREAREAFEREYLLTQVNRFSGNISQTARFIGMERSALHRKLRALGIQGFRNGEEGHQEHDKEAQKDDLYNSMVS